MRGTENLFGRFLSLLSARLVSTVIAVLSTPIIVRLLGPGGYGDYAVLLSIFSLYMIPISATITEGVQKFVGEKRDIQYWTEGVVAYYLAIGSVIVLVGAAILLGVTLVGVPARLYGDSFSAYFLLLVVFVIAAQYRALGYRTVLGFGLERLAAPLAVMRKFGTVSIGIGLLFVGYGVSGMLVGHIVSNVLVAIVAATILVRRISISNMLQGVRAIPGRELMSFNVINVGLVLLSMSLYHVDVIMIRSLIDSQSTGHYKAALSLAEYLWFVPIVVQQLMLHSTSKLWTDGQTEEITRIAGRITRWVVLLVLLLAVGLGTLAHRVVPIYYGQSFAIATTPLLILLPGVVGFAAARPLKSITQSSGRVKTLLLAVGAAATINLVLNVLLIPAFGMIGAAVATSIGYSSMFVFLFGAARRVGYDPFDDFRGVRIGATVVGSSVPIVVLDRLIGPDVVALVVVPIVGALVFAYLAIRTGALDAEELQMILRQLPGPFGNGELRWVDR